MKYGINIMNIRLCALMLALTAAAFPVVAGTAVEQGPWSIVNADDNTLTISFDGKEAIKNAYAEVTYRTGASQDSRVMNSSTLTPVSVTVSPMTDELGTGRTLARVYNDGTAVMTQTINVYDNNPYIVAQVTIESADHTSKVESNRMVALATVTQSAPMKSTVNRMVCVPYDNDCYGSYKNLNFSEEMVSHEVGYVYDATSASRFGFVAGSIDHDKWKSGILIKGSSKRYLEALELLSGYTDVDTRDFDWESSEIIPHGYVKGTQVSSARYLVGFFDDWREGMETFAGACAIVAPPAPWDNGNVMGWNSWGVMQSHVNFDGVRETAEWIKDNLYDLGFHDRNGRTVISLDSFADGDRIMQPDMSRLGNQILGNGTYKEGRVTKTGLDMTLGLYGGIVIWDWTFDSQVQGTGMNGNPSYKWGDALLKHEGNVHRLVNNGSYCAIDPTHPAFRASVEYALERWSRFNVKYIKMDFITCAACEGDSWYDPEITTGIMAYNYAMKLLYEVASKYDMYIVEGISPLFPYQWAHGRRTCCDSFSGLGDSEFVMNAMSWGWWTDRLYAVNDPDQLVLVSLWNNGQESEGENRVRVTSGLCTGAFIIGDNFSDKCVYTDDNGHTKGSVVGYPDASKARALKMFGNADINEYVRENTGSFRPVDGNVISVSKQSVSVFMRDTPQYLYVAVFNFAKSIAKAGSVNYSDIDIEPSNVKEIKELWTGSDITPKASTFSYDVPGGDVRLYRITKAVAGVEDIVVDAESGNTLSAVISGGQCVVAADRDIAEVSVYDLSGRLVAAVSDINHVQAVFDINAGSGVYIVNALLADGSRVSAKVMTR